MSGNEEALIDSLERGHGGGGVIVIVADLH